MGKSQKPRREDLLAKIKHLESRLAEAEETLRAIRSGEVDALAIETAVGINIFTLKGADYPYQMIVENIDEGAVTVVPDGMVLYCNCSVSKESGQMKRSNMRLEMSWC